jgi:hypothetical protein
MMSLVWLLVSLGRGDHLRKPKVRDGREGFITAVRMAITAAEEVANLPAIMRSLELNEDVAIALFDTHMNYVWHTRGWVLCFPPTNDTCCSLVGRNHYEVYAGAISEEWMDVHRRAIAGEVISNSNDLWAPHGEEQRIAWTCSPWRSPDGEQLGMIATGMTMHADSGGSNGTERTDRTSRASSGSGGRIGGEEGCYC